MFITKRTNLTRLDLVLERLPAVLQHLVQTPPLVGQREVHGLGQGLGLVKVQDLLRAVVARLDKGHEEIVDALQEGSGGGGVAGGRKEIWEKKIRKSLPEKQ